ncbi:hypothetical protein FRB94_014227 [Tulasnella sp. JGI-2019a]|nr:hypothetical protein FRB93_005426 [Tulasnella sp. JGI-2019a]KAG9014134.1 hypothetical protein FRB94_014227 [Tulasnella sp. JGI-2019a]KAG9027536.1 hypothetical protein FRB95_007637 [Tulasnella sp. JGI-2019a]
MKATAAVSVLTTISGALAAYVSVDQVAADNVVYINSATDFCMIFPRYPGMNVGDSEYTGGTQTFCTNPYNAALQGTLPQNFWSQVAYVTGVGATGQNYVQLTGCINAGSTDHLNAADSGGQYDSNGGQALAGNPQGSACLGFNSYVELLEPAGNRACLKCCNDPADCPVNMDTDGCQAVIPGNYFGCTN